MMIPNNHFDKDLTHAQKVIVAHGGHWVLNGSTIAFVDTDGGIRLRRAWHPRVVDGESMAFVTVPRYEVVERVCAVQGHNGAIGVHRQVVIHDNVANEDVPLATEEPRVMTKEELDRRRQCCSALAAKFNNDIYRLASHMIEGGTCQGTITN